MEKQMRAERDKRAAILTAEGTKQAAILQAEGERQAAILNAEGDAKAQILRAEGEAKAIETVFGAIHEGNPDAPLLAYQYLQTLPKIAEGDASKLWIIPSELSEALKGISAGFSGTTSPNSWGGPSSWAAEQAAKSPSASRSTTRRPPASSSAPKK
jgi:regulator of protease activity HflC (stomatin/prohibitin superfamily)